MWKFILACAGILLGHVSLAQELKGKVVDAETAKGIPFATILVKEIGVATNADEEGRFVLEGSLPETVELLVTAPLYESLEIQVKTGDSVQLQMKAAHHDIQEIVVFIDPGVMNKNTTAKVDRLSMRELQLLGPTSVVDAAANIPGVQVVSAGLSAPKPVIRGMQGIRVVTLVNGMRVENQQWGADHGLGISQLGVEAVEVIKGPAGLEYAGDALGGTLYLKDQNSVSQGHYFIDINSGFESVNLGTTNSFMARFAHKHIRYAVGAITSSNADFQLSNGKYLKDSRFSDHGAKVNFGANKGIWDIQANYLYSNSHIGISGHTHDSLVTPESFQSDERGREVLPPFQFIQNHFFNVLNTFRIKHGHKLSIRTTFTSNDLREHEEKIYTPAIGMLLNTGTVQAKYIWQPNYSNKMTIGATSRLQSNRNEANAEERILVDYDQSDYALYGLYFWTPGPFQFEFAARGDYRSLSSSGFSAEYLTPNASVGGKYKWWLGEMHTVRLNIASGTRAPHISELLSDGPHHGASRYELGDSTLNPERLTQIDFDYELESDHLDIVINPFYSYAQNYIQLAARDSVIDGLPVYQYEAISQARLYGLDVGLHYHPHFAHALHFESGFSMVYGESFDKVPLYQIPQTQIRSKVRVNIKHKKKIGFNGVMVQHQYYFAQDRIGILETGTAGYHLLNAGASVEWKGKYPVTLTFGVRNALNATYVNHLSRLKNLGQTEPGRSFYVKLHIGIGGKFKKGQEEDLQEVIQTL